MVRRNHAARHASCGIERLDRAMDTTNNRLVESADGDFDAELEMWDWARAAGVSADDLREALQDLQPGFERKAA